MGGLVLCSNSPLHRRSYSRTRLEQSLDVRADGVRRVVPRVPLDEIAVLVEQELLEVPGDVRARHWGPEAHRGAAEAAARQDERVDVVAAVSLSVALGVLGDHDLALHPLEERVSVGAIHVGLAHDVALGFEAAAGPHVLEGVEELILSCGLEKRRRREDTSRGEVEREVRGKQSWCS